MKTLVTLMLMIVGLPFASKICTAADQLEPVYELRTYYAEPGKLQALLTRFRDHTVKLFEKHGITNVGYWLPVDNPDNRLICLLSYPNREACETSWKAFMEDPDWMAAKTATEKDGKLLTKVEAPILTATDYSPKPVIEAKTPARQFELRIYTTNEGKLANLDMRFREHTMKLFEKHGIANVLYLHLMPDQPGAANTLVYLLAHKDDAARRESFKSFSADPSWQSVRQASEEAGPILIEGGVKSVPMMVTDFSPMK